jgi:uncharacterized membrane protein YeaQ/YmgE (transglycosylase-associated protein family)
MPETAAGRPIRGRAVVCTQERPMDTQKLVIMAAIGIVAGWLASLLVGIKGGLIGMLIAGLLGGIVGGLLFGAIGVRLTGNGIVDNIIQSAVGAIIVILLARMFL